MDMNEDEFWLEAFDTRITRMATKRVDGQNLNPWERRFRQWARKENLLDVEELCDDIDCSKQAELYFDDCDKDPTAEGCENISYDMAEPGAPKARRDLADVIEPRGGSATALADDSVDPAQIFGYVIAAVASFIGLALLAIVVKAMAQLPPSSARPGEARRAGMTDQNALNLRWTFGFNLDYGSGALVDLTTDGRQAVFYSVGHTGVIFDYEVRQQRLLQGHTNTISCAAASDDKKWLVTGDTGERDTMVVIWNARTGVPVRTIFEAHPGGCIDLDMSPDAMYITTLGAGDAQQLAVWD